jgi:hypothetical protein
VLVFNSKMQFWDKMPIQTMETTSTNILLLFGLIYSYFKVVLDPVQLKLKLSENSELLSKLRQSFAESQNGSNSLKERVGLLGHVLDHILNPDKVIVDEILTKLNEVGGTFILSVVALRGTREQILSPVITFHNPGGRKDRSNQNTHITSFPSPSVGRSDGKKPSKYPKSFFTLLIRILS